MTQGTKKKKQKKNRKLNKKPATRPNLADAAQHRNEQTLHGGVRSFLRDAGIEAHDLPGGVRIDGVPFLFAPEELRTPYWKPVVERLVAERFGDRLLPAIATHLTTQDSALRATQHGAEVHVADAEAVVAVITATRAITVRPRRVIPGNFLAASGRHWDALDAQIIHRKSGATRSARLGAEPLIAFPDELDGMRRTVALEASSRIRLTRWREFSLGVQIDILRGPRSSVH